MNIKEFVNELYEYEKIYIYGAGEYGKTLARYLMQIGLANKIEAFVVTNKGEKKIVLGKPILALPDVEGHFDVNALLIIAVAEKKQAEIVKNIEKMHISNLIMMTTDIYNLSRKCITEMTNGVSDWFQEIQNGMNFNAALQDSKWLKRKDFAPGGMAVNSRYLYTLYKILDSGKFKSFLDIGMGQTSKMIGQYADLKDDVEHIIVEADEEWVDFFNTLNGVTRSQIELLSYKMKQINGIDVRVFDGFAEKLSGKKFDYISIDAPLGGDMTEYSRIDILDILPECLDESWVLMMDDVGRNGEKNTLKELKNILEKNGIQYVERQYVGADRNFIILTSIDNRFFCTV